jgi:hypothetical protein
MVTRRPTVTDMAIDWNNQLVEQLDWHWRNQLRQRLEGLSDDEYFWEPVPGCWSVRRRGESTAPIAAGAGDFTIDFAFPEPDPSPVTTIAWRLGHIVVGVLGARVASLPQLPLGVPPSGPIAESFSYAGTAEEALAQLDEVYAAWTAGVRRLGDEGLEQPCGPAEGPFANQPMASLVLHINREMIHHTAEIALLRDLYRHRKAGIF